MDDIDDHTHSSMDDIDHHTHSSFCLLVSTLLLAGTAILTATFRSVIRHRLRPGLLSHCLLDFLCGVELCVCGMELGTVLDIYGIPMYCVFLWLVIIWQAVSWGDSTANPYGHLLRLAEGSQTWLETLVRILCGAVGSLSSLTVISPLWNMGWSHYHMGRTQRSGVGACGSDLQVSIFAGTLVEMFGTLGCFLAGNLLQDLPMISSKPLLLTSLDSAASVALVIAAFDLTGGYYNPALATGIKLGCGLNDDDGHLGHLAVYWVGPCIGALLAGPVYQKAKNVFIMKQKDENKIKSN